MDIVYRANPISSRRQELRLITIKSGSTLDRLECHLETCALSDTTQAYNEFLDSAVPSNATASEVLKAWQGSQQLTEYPQRAHHRFSWGDYAALSYVWGDTQDTTAILVNGKEARITKNLAAALHSLRQTGAFTDNFRLWVDALCINQKDDIERSKQVAEMRFFYTRAWSVLGYLGPQMDDSDFAIELLASLASVADDQEQCEALRIRLIERHFLHKPGSWLALNRLLLRPYWSRLWIMQEVSIGGARMMLMCGTVCISLVTLCRGIGVIHNYLWVARHEALVEDARTHIAPDDDRGWDATRTLDHLWKDIWLLMQILESQYEAAKFSRLLEMANTCDCHDARDKVYAMLGLMDAKLARAIAPNYTADVAEVFLHTAQAYVTTYNNLELLRDANLCGRAGLSTWVPDWTWQGRPYDSRPDDFYQAKTDEPFRRPYKADHTLKFSRPQFDGDRLVCKAIIFDTVDGLGSNAEADNPSHFVQSTESHSIYGSLEKTTHNLAVTLYGGRRSWPTHTTSILSLPLTQDSAVEQFSRLAWESFEADAFHYHRWTRWYDCNASLRVGGIELREYFTGEIPVGLPPADMMDYWTAYGAWVRTALAGCRRLMVTSGGRIGWAPCANSNVAGRDAEAQKGDVLSIFPGCSTPLLLRPTKEKSVFQVVGEAYVQGMMDGEVIGLLQSCQHELETVSLI